MPRDWSTDLQNIHKAYKRRDTLDLYLADNTVLHLSRGHVERDLGEKAGIVVYDNWIRSVEDLRGSIEQSIDRITIKCQNVNSELGFKLASNLRLLDFATAGLTSVGDAVEHVCHKTNAWGIYVRNANYAQIFGVYGGTLQEVHPGGNHTGSMTPLQAGDICRIEMVTGGKLRFSINGVTQYTSVNTYTTSVGDFVFTIDADVPLGTVIKVPKWYGSGITNYNEARATIAVLLRC